MDRLIEILVRLIVWVSKYTALLAKWGIGEYSAWQPGDKIKLLLVGYNGTRNTGADARVIAMTEQIEQLFGAEQVQISVMTLDKDTMHGYFNPRVQLVPFSTIFFFELYKQCARHHAVILCEGSTLKSTFANALTMFFCEAAGIMKNQKKPCIAYGSEIGEMEPFLEKLARDLCSDTYFIVRTEDSYQRLLALGLQGHVGTDTAWTFDDTAVREMMKEKLLADGWDGSSPILGVAVINPFWWPVKPSIWRWIYAAVTKQTDLQYNKLYFFSDSQKRREQFHSYVTQIADAVNRIGKEQQYHIAVIGMERLDAAACIQLKTLLQVPCSMFLSRDYTAFELTGVLRNLSYLITSRYHASVLSMERAIPVIAVSMDERLNGIMKELHLQDRYLYSVQEPQLGDKLYQALQLAEEECDFIESQIQHKLAYYYETLAQMGAFLKKYLVARLEGQMAKY